MAQTVNAITSGLPGRPLVRVAGDGWVLAGRTGTTTSCDTVEQLWSALVPVHVPGAASRLAQALAGSLPASSALADRVLREGMAVVEPFRSGVMAT
ncbi:hypothetical protein [Arthrobacter sp. MDT1-65]